MTESSPRRIALLLEYNGKDYHGSQLQKREPTIQSELESAILNLTAEQARVTFAGRTDAGVHAEGQVAAFNTLSRHGESVFERGLNALLPESIAIRRAREVESAFDPRRHATSRTYRYFIHNASERSPLCLDRAWHVPGTLDVRAMQAAAGMLEGEHDFAAFSRREPTSTLRSVMSCSMMKRGKMVTLAMTANAFLRQQVRRTVGALVQVGLGKRSIDWFRDTLSSAELASAGPVAPAHGLVLLSVRYPDLDLTVGERYDECQMGLEGPNLIAGNE